MFVRVEEEDGQREVRFVRVCSFVFSLRSEETNAILLGHSEDVQYS